MASIRRMHSINAGRPHEALSVLQLAYETLREFIDDPGRWDRLRGVLLRMARLGEDNGMPAVAVDALIELIEMNRRRGDTETRACRPPNAPRTTAPGDEAG